MPEVHHLGCFVDWIKSGKERVCDALTDMNLVFSTKSKEMNELLEWDDLIVSMILCMLCVCVLSYAKCIIVSFFIMYLNLFLLCYTLHIIH